MVVQGKRAANEQIHTVHCAMRKNVVLSHKAKAVNKEKA